MVHIYLSNKVNALEFHLIVINYSVFLCYILTFFNQFTSFFKHHLILIIHCILYAIH